LQLERRTVSGEPDDVALAEALAILAALRAEDPEFEGTARFLFGRPAYETEVQACRDALVDVALAFCAPVP
jgi:hypothetical protein